MFNSINFTMYGSFKKKVFTPHPLNYKPRSSKLLYHTEAQLEQLFIQKSSLIISFSET